MTQLSRRPLRFTPHIVPKVWGGRRLERFGRDLPASQKIGETWEVSAIEGRSSLVSTGPHAGVTLSRLLDDFAGDIVGDAAVPAGARFPLLIKLLDSSEPLSVQLHPRDHEAVEIEGPGEGSVGKTEAWLILEAEPDARIVHGIGPGVSPPELYERLESARGRSIPEDEEESLFRWRGVERGDVIFVPAGSLHALGPGIVLAEVQQSSDLTYRLYDWGRAGDDGKPRELHLDQARRVAAAEDVRCPWARIDSGAASGELLSCDCFTIDRFAVTPGDGERLSTREERGRRCHILMAWTRFILCTADEEIGVEPFQFILLPASLGDYELRSAGAPGICVRFTPGW